jgi:hypothetical protein
MKNGFLLTTIPIKVKSKRLINEVRLLLLTIAIAGFREKTLVGVFQQRDQLSGVTV